MAGDRMSPAGEVFRRIQDCLEQSHRVRDVLDELGEFADPELGAELELLEEHADSLIDTLGNTWQRALSFEELYQRFNHKTLNDNADDC